jgi:hypothetical protein
MRNMVKAKAVERAKFEGLDQDERIVKEGNPYFGKLEQLAMDKMAFYHCFECKIPYYGGMRDCAEAMRREEQEEKPVKAEELVCRFCTTLGMGAGKNNCAKHGFDNIEFKCRYCCSTSLWYCFGTTHFCEPCHQRCDYVVKPCPGPEQCMFHGCHPPNGEEFAIGCSMCRMEKEAEAQPPVAAVEEVKQEIQ